MARGNDGRIPFAIGTWVSQTPKKNCVDLIPKNSSFLWCVIFQSALTQTVISFLAIAILVYNVVAAHNILRGESSTLHLNCKLLNLPVSLESLSNLLLHHRILCNKMKSILINLCNFECFFCGAFWVYHCILWSSA